MRLRYFQRVRVEPISGVAILDGSIGGETETQANSYAASMVKGHPGVTARSIPAVLEWTDEQSWQDLATAKFWDNPGFLWRLTDRDPRARIKGETQTMPCTIYWCSGDFGATMANRVYINRANAAAALSKEFAAGQTQTSRLTEGQLTIPAGIKLVGEEEHKYYEIDWTAMQADFERRAILSRLGDQ